MSTVWLALALELVTRISGASAQRATALDHEVWDDAMKLKAIVEVARSEVQEGGHGDGRVIGKEGEVDVAFTGVDSDFDVVHGFV